MQKDNNYTVLLRKPDGFTASVASFSLPRTTGVRFDKDVTRMTTVVNDPNTATAYYLTKLDPGMVNFAAGNNVIVECVKSRLLFEQIKHSID